MAADKHINSDQFLNVLRGSYPNAQRSHEDEDYLMSIVECDNCGNDVHMDDVKVVKPERYSDNTKVNPNHVTNYYCGDNCKEQHQSGERKGRIR